MNIGSSYIKPRSLYSIKSSEYYAARSSLPASIEGGVIGERYIQAKDRFVKVKEGYSSEQGLERLTVVRKATGSGFSRCSESVVANSVFDSLFYTRYTKSPRSNRILEENFRLAPDGSFGPKGSMYLIDQEQDDAWRPRETPRWARENGFPKKGIGSFIASIAEAETQPTKVVDLNPPLTPELQRRADEVKATVEELGLLAKAQDGTHHDRDREQNGQVDLVAHSSKAGIPLSQPRTGKVRRTGLGVLLGKKTVDNPYQWISSQGHLSSNSETGEVTGLEISRRVTKRESDPEAPELRPAHSEATFRQTDYENAKVYEARSEAGSVQRLIVEPSGALSYFEEGAIPEEQLNYDLPSFKERAFVPQIEAKGVKAEYLEQHAKIAELGEKERAVGWIDLCLEGEVDSQYAMDRLREQPLTRDQARVARMVQREADNLASVDKAATLRGTLQAFKQHLSGELTAKGVGDGARAIALSSYKESGETRQTYFDAGMSALYKLAIAEGSTELKLQLPAGESEGRVFGELLAMGEA